MSSSPLAPAQSGLSIIGSFLLKRLDILLFAVVVALLIVSRVALAPGHLNTFDDINFALSIKRFNPALHQPQPPGYPLFVGLLRLGALLIPRVEDLFLSIAILGSVLSLVLLWVLGDDLLGKGTGLIAAALLLFHPSFWFAALTNPVRVFLAAGSIGVAVCLVKALSRSRSIFWYYLAAAAFGIAAGFRPDLPFTLFPLMLYAAWRLRLTLKQMILAAVIAAVIISAWLLPTIVAVGGPLPFIALIRNYGNAEGASTSILLGAPWRSALQMAYTTTVWTFTGALSWLWCAPFVVRRRERLLTRFEWRLLLVWLVSGFLFYALVHTGDPDHPLAIIPVTCLIGAVALTRFARRYGPQWLAVIVAVAVGLNALLFFKPINKTAKAASYKSARWLNGYMDEVIESIRAMRASGPVTVVSAGVIPGWRNVSYYFPDVPILLIRSQNPQIPSGWQLYEGRMLPFPVKEGVVALPTCGTIAWIDPGTRPHSPTGGEVTSAKPDAPISFTPAIPGASYVFRGFHFHAGTGACANSAASKSP